MPKLTPMQSVSLKVNMAQIFVQLIRLQKLNNVQLLFSVNLIPYYNSFQTNMRYSYKDIFELRDLANIKLKSHLPTHQIVCVAKYDFVDVNWQNSNDSSQVLLVENITRDECHRWLAGFITAMEIKDTKSVNIHDSWWSKNVRPLFKLAH